MRLFCEYPTGTLRNATTVADKYAVSRGVRVMPGIGKPFLIFSPSPGFASAVDFSMYPQYVVSANESENLAMINDMLANPPIDAVTLV